MRLTITAPKFQRREDEELSAALSRVQRSEEELARRKAQAETRPAYVSRPPAINAPALLTENLVKDGYEIRFPGKIAPDLSATLISAGFRFTRGGWVDPRWYTKRTPESRAAAIAIVKSLGGIVNLQSEGRPAPVVGKPTRVTLAIPK